MPFWDFQCKKCKEVFEVLVIKIIEPDPIICPKCGGTRSKRLMPTSFQYRANSDVVLHNPPDPSPPLEELRGHGSEGYRDKPEVETNLGKYNRRKDKMGNTIWEERKKLYFT